MSREDTDHRQMRPSFVHTIGRSLTPNTTLAKRQMVWAAEKPWPPDNSSIVFVIVVSTCIVLRILSGAQVQRSRFMEDHPSSTFLLISARFCKKCKRDTERRSCLGISQSARTLSSMTPHEHCPAQNPTGVPRIHAATIAEFRRNPTRWYAWKCICMHARGLTIAAFLRPSITMAQIARAV